MTTENLLADTPTGRTDRTVVVGGHLDSVGEGPGINDNGSGTAAILETALQMAELGITPENRVRFAFWSGEEDGLLGSDFYVSQLTKREIKGTAVNLNFDMVGSPNAVNFVYDGDGDALGVSGPNGSGLVEDVFTDFFTSQGEASASRRTSTDAATTSRSSTPGSPRAGSSPGPRASSRPSRRRSSAGRRERRTTPATTRRATPSPTSSSRPWTSCPTPSPTPP